MSAIRRSVFRKKNMPNTNSTMQDKLDSARSSGCHGWNSCSSALRKPSITPLIGFTSASNQCNRCGTICTG